MDNFQSFELWRQPPAQRTHPTCDFVDSGTCKASGKGDFGQLRPPALPEDTHFGSQPLLQRAGFLSIPLCPKP